MYLGENLEGNRERIYPKKYSEMPKIFFFSFFLFLKSRVLGVKYKLGTLFKAQWPLFVHWVGSADINNIGLGMQIELILMSLESSGCLVS